MKKDILNQFKNSLVSRALANTIVGGYSGSTAGDGGRCNGIGCPMFGGFCQILSRCTGYDGKSYAHYSCTVAGASQSYKDSVIAANPNTTLMFQASYTMTCTGVGFV
jgi:hypothetical protein